MYQRKQFYFNRQQKKSFMILTIILSFSVLLFVGVGYIFQDNPKQKKVVVQKENKIEKQNNSFEIQDSSLIRVLLTKNSKPSRKKVSLLLRGDYLFQKRTNKHVVKKKGDILKFADAKNCSKGKSDCFKLIPQDKEATVKIIYEDGSYSNAYRGNICIYVSKDGFFVVNELTVQEYLYGVVPSEMPSDYEMEALKAQAICARSYAYKQMKDDTMKEFYADVDDTTNFQVYLASEEKARTRKAVDETLNTVVTYKGQIATTYYYSTSCGMMQSCDLWNLNKEKFGYLKREPVSIQGENFEGSAKQFLKKKQKDDLEKDYRYYRWSAEFSLKDNKDDLISKLNERRTVSRNNIVFLLKNEKECLDASDLGNPITISVVNRNEGYGIESMEIIFKKGKAIITKEYNIRVILAACHTKVKLQDGNIVYPELLPSACFYVKSIKHGVIKICGGGFGHGLGMSQNGANELAKKGYDYEKILTFFFKDTEVKSVIQER